MFVTYHVRIPDTIRVVLSNIDKLKEFKLFLRDHQFNDDELNLIYKFIGFDVRFTMSNPKFVDSIMKYSGYATDYEQLHSVLHLILLLYRRSVKYFDLRIEPDKILDLLIDENGNLRSSKEISEINFMIEIVLKKNQQQKLLKYSSSISSYLLFTTMITILHFPTEIPDQLLERLTKFEKFDYPMDTNVLFLTDLYLQKKITEEDMLSCVEYLHLEPKRFRDIVKQYTSKTSS